MGIAGQIRTAFLNSGLTVDALREKSGIALERSALQRRLSGARSMKTEEAEKLATALGITLEWPRRPPLSAPVRGSKAKKKAA